MARMFKTLLQENETVIRLKGVCPGHRLAPGLLLAGKDRMRSELEVCDGFFFVPLGVGGSQQHLGTSQRLSGRAALWTIPPVPLPRGHA